MKLSDSFRLSANSITHRRLRSWLTLLGIVIGVAAVVSIISIGEGAQASVNAQLSGLGADIITITPGHSRAGMFTGSFRGGREFSQRTVNSEDSDEPTLTKLDSSIVRGNPNVLYVNETVSGRADIVFLSEEGSASIEGVNPNAWRETSNLELASGRFLTSSDASAIVIGSRIANDMFKQPITIGRRITVEGRQFTVVGILKASGSGGFGSGGSDGTIYMTHLNAWDLADVEKGTYSSLQVKVSDESLVEEATEQLTQSLLILRKVTADTQDFSLTSSQAIQEQVSSVTETLTLFLAAIAAVSLIVGAVGVANSMFTSVLEKTREIGILKALGSTNNEILIL